LDRKKKGVMIIILIVGIMLVCIPLWQALMPRTNSQTGNSLRITLPTPQHDSNVSIEEALLERRSIREYTDEPLTLLQVSQLLWATQGITDSTGKRTAPSAGALYPLEVYIEVGNVENLGKGVYKYSPHGHELIKALDGDKRSQLAQAASGQSSVENSAINIVIAAVFERTFREFIRNRAMLFWTIGWPAIWLVLGSIVFTSGTPNEWLPQVKGSMTITMIGFALMTAGMGNLAGSIARDKEKGAYQKIASMPVKPWEDALGRLIGLLTFALVGSIVVLIIGMIIGAKFDGGVNDALQSIAYAFLVILSSSGIGLIVSSMTKTEGAAN
jgi:nitroreductase